MAPALRRAGPRAAFVLLAALVVGVGAARAQPERFVVHPSSDGPADAVRLDTYTGAVAVLTTGADGDLAWTRIGVPPGARLPSSYTGPSYALTQLPLTPGETFLVDGQGGRTWLLRRSGDALAWHELP